MRIIQTNNNYKKIRVCARSVQKVLRRLDNFDRWKIPAGELSVAFLDDPAMIKLHADFLDDPTPTDVITFPGDASDETFAGEICICIDQAIREAPKHNNTLAQELLLYLIHGRLHLAGHDDLSDAPRAAMRLAERETLAWLAGENIGLVLRNAR